MSYAAAFIRDPPAGVEGPVAPRFNSFSGKKRSRDAGVQAHLAPDLRMVPVMNGSSHDASATYQPRPSRMTLAKTMATGERRRSRAYRSSKAFIVAMARVWIPTHIGR